MSAKVGAKVLNFPARAKIQMYGNFLEISQGYIFHILQYFTAKLCSDTDFKIIFRILDFSAYFGTK